MINELKVGQIYVYKFDVGQICIIESAVLSENGCLTNVIVRYEINSSRPKNQEHFERNWEFVCQI